MYGRKLLRNVTCADYGNFHEIQKTEFMRCSLNLRETIIHIPYLYNEPMRILKTDGNFFTMLEMQKDENSEINMRTNAKQNFTQES